MSLTSLVVAAENRSAQEPYARLTTRRETSFPAVKLETKFFVLVVIVRKNAEQNN